MRWSGVGLVAVVLACAGTSPRPVMETPGPAKDVTWVFRVVDPDGQPVPDARVNLWRVDQTPAHGQPGTTDAQGTGSLALKPGRYSAHVQAPGFVTAFHLDIRIAPDSTPRLDLPLVRSAPLAGRVVDAEGNPVPGVRLRFASANPSVPFVSSVSGADGQFTLEGVAVGEGLLDSDKEGGNWQRLKVTTPQPALTVVMGRLSSLLVRVVDPEGHPIPNARSSITCMDRPCGLTHQFEQTPEGTVHLSLPARRYFVSASYESAPGCWWHRVVEVDVPAGQRAEATVSFEGFVSAGPWTGRAVKPDGQPLANMKLRVEARPTADGLTFEDSCWVTTEMGGYFELPRPLAGIHHLEVRSELDFSTVVGEVEREPSAVRNETVVFHSPGTLGGRVLGPDGRPLLGYSLEGSSTSRPEGRFILGGVASRIYSLHIDDEDLAPVRVRVEAREHEDRTVPDIQLEKGRSVLGRLLEADGRTPVSKVWIEMVDPSDLDFRRWGTRFGAHTDEAGRFRLDHVPRRTQYLRVNRENGGTLLYELGARERQVDLQLKPDATLEGFVTDGARVPLAGVTLVARCGSGLETRTQSDDTGHYVLRVPADRNCFVQFPDERLWIYSWPQPAQPVFSLQPVSLAPRLRERRDFVPRKGDAALQVHFPKTRERLATFLVPDTVRMPKTFADLKALQRSSFTSDHALITWRTDEPDLSGSRFRQKDFTFSQLSGKRYTLFAVEADPDGATSVLRVPVDLKPGETKSLQLGFPTESGGTWFVP